MHDAAGEAAGPAPATPGAFVYRHSIVVRATHWLFSLAFLVLVMSGLQIFNASPNLDASDKSDPARRVLSIGAEQGPGGQPVGVTRIFGLRFTTTHVLGYGSDGMDAETARAFPGWITLPGYQDLAGGRRWHLFFAWIMVICGAAYIVAGFLRKDLSLLILRPRDVPKLLPMQLYYLKIRREPPPHGTYNPLQKAAYTAVLFVFAPLIVISGLALAPGVDAIAHPITTLLGGRQFARLWHFVAMIALLGFVGIHLTMVFTQGAVNNIRSMITGLYRLGPHDGVGV
jgi:thiosulfate reductase cytochrome b subunit